jgi:hypothetical protein
MYLSPELLDEIFLRIFDIMYRPLEIITNSTKLYAFRESCHADYASQFTEQDLLSFAIILPLIKNTFIWQSNFSDF